MNVVSDLCAATSAQALEWGVRIGFDLVQIGPLRDSFFTFGESFTDRLFTRDELAYSMQAPAVLGPRLAARFAAKEAVIKVLQLSEVGACWRDIEVIKLDGGDCRVQLHGHVAHLAHDMGLAELMLSLSHDGNYAGAIVAARFHHSASNEGKS